MGGVLPWGAGRRVPATRLILTTKTIQWAGYLTVADVAVPMLAKMHDKRMEGPKVSIISAWAESDLYKKRPNTVLEFGLCLLDRHQERIPITITSKKPIGGS